MNMKVNTCIVAIGACSVGLGMLLTILSVHHLQQWPVQLLQHMRASVVIVAAPVFAALVLLPRVGV